MNHDVCCREIATGDIPQLIELLLTGFPERSRVTWERAFTRLNALQTPPGYPKFGHLLAHRDRPVGLVLTCFSTVMCDTEESVRCSLSSWYVAPEFRCYGAMLSARAVMRREVTYLNITPHPGTFEILAALGYRRYCNGIFFSLPALAERRPAEVLPFDGRPSNQLSSFENRLLAEHAAYGCVVLICRAEGSCFPFVFATTRVCRLPAAYLCYCRDVADFVRFAAPIGRFLARQGHPLVIVDANGPVAGLVGKYYDGWPKFFKGPNQPRIGDLAYTERPLFGV
jgi:hypothetical protein